MKATILYDVDGWAYHRRALALKKHAPPDIEVELVRVGQYNGEPADVLIVLDYVCLPTISGQADLATMIVCTFSADLGRRERTWQMVHEHSNWVIALSRERYEQRGDVRHCCCIANGVDLEDFGLDAPIGSRPERVLWTGKDSKDDNKGLRAVLQPLAKLAAAHNFECDFRPVPQHRLLTTDEMRAWYNRGAYVICASRSEATANVVMEAAACGCVPVSTPVGTLTDWGKDGENCVLVTERSPEAFMDGLLRARRERLRLAAGAMEAVARYDYKRIAGLYWERVVRPLVEAKPMEPFCYLDLEAFA